MTHWEDGFAAGYARAMMLYGLTSEDRPPPGPRDVAMLERVGRSALPSEWDRPKKRKRKLSEWQKYVKVNSKKPRFKFKSGSKRGRVNFKALGIAFRKTPAGKKKRR